MSNFPPWLALIIYIFLDLSNEGNETVEKEVTKLTKRKRLLKKK
jgi:hypothetical protein